MKSRVALAVPVLAASLACTAPAVTAQVYPARPVRVVVPSEPGGGTDIAARQIAARLYEETRQQFLIDNRGGAGGLLGIENVAKSPPDGYSLLITSASFSATLATHRTSANPIDSLTSVSQIGYSPFVLIVPASSVATTVPELIALARQKPGAISYASAGIGSNTHLAIELMAHMAGIQMVHVPYKGAGPSMNDLMNGRVDLTLGAYSTIEGNIRAGKMRALAVTNSKRVPSLPSLPSLAEYLPGYEVELWFGMMAPKGTAATTITQLNASINRIVRAPDNRKSLEDIGILPEAGSPQQFGELVRADYERWIKVIRESNIQLQ